MRKSQKKQGFPFYFYTPKRRKRRLSLSRGPSSPSSDASAMVYVCLLYAGKFLQKQQPYAAMTSESRPLESPSIPKQPARELPKF